MLELVLDKLDEEVKKDLKDVQNLHLELQVDYTDPTHPADWVSRSLIYQLGNLKKESDPVQFSFRCWEKIEMGQHQDPRKRRDNKIKNPNKGENVKDFVLRYEKQHQACLRENTIPPLQSEVCGRKLIE